MEELLHRVKIFDKVKIGDNYQGEPKVETDYQFIIQSNKINPDEVMFTIMTHTLWTFDNTNKIESGAMVTLFPKAFNHKKPTFDELKDAIALGRHEISLAYREDLKSIIGDETENIELEQYNEGDLGKLKIAFDSSNGLN